MSADAAVLMLNFLQLRMHLMHFAFRLLRRHGEEKGYDGSPSEQPLVTLVANSGP